MNIFNHKILLAILACLFVNVVFCQHKNVDTLQLVIPEGLETFTEKIEIAEYNTYFYTEVALPNGSYKIKNKNQEAEFILENNLISGTVTTYKNFKKGQHKEGDSFKTDYKFDKSLVTEFTIFADDRVFVKAYRTKENQAFWKEYDKEGRIKEESQASLKHGKNFGLSITKRYDKDGKIYEITDETIETITQFYPNGSTKSVMDKTAATYFNEDGIITRKVNFKTKPFYDDEFVNGKLHSRSYKNDENEEVKEYFKNGILEKKEIAKIINGEKMTFVYNKLGKLIDKYPYFIKDQKISETVSGQKAIATAEQVSDPPSVATEKMTESEIIPANFPGKRSVS